MQESWFFLSIENKKKYDILADRLFFNNDIIIHISLMKMESIGTYITFFNNILQIVLFCVNVTF
jgi:hypothetical protein